MTSRRSAGLRGWMAALCLLPGVLAACSGDDPGPGVVELVVSGDVPLGGVVVELTGEGLMGVQERPGLTAAFRALPGSGGVPRARIVAVQATAGPLLLRVDVARAGGTLPTAAVIEAADGDDALLPGFALPSIEVRRVP
ncbi:MAG TPA: hypothetical protein VK858_02805 [Longimicrobiales bacterium]|nr:hypothetical protein [Longimicrobiales bacterium]